jgi:hypothetical protein
MNYEDRSWSRYDFGFNCYGAYQEGEYTLTLDDIDDAFDDLEIAFDDNTRQAGYPITLAGDSSGYIWKINYGSDDNGSAINFEALSGRWNPFLKDGMKVRFGWISFLVENDSGIDMSVEFYVNREAIAHTTQTVTFTEDIGIVGGGSPDKVWVRADNGAIGDFHRVKLINNQTAQTVKIYAMLAWMKPAGVIR